MDIDITQKLLDRYETKYTKVGRYSVSMLYAIKAGWVKPEDFVVTKKNDWVGILRMWSGVMNHNFIESLLEKDKCEQKVEYPYKDIVVVGKADYLPDEENVWDFKTSDHTMDKAKPWHNHQLKMYCTMFKRKFGHIYQPVIRDKSVVLKHLGTVQRNDEWFEKELESLYIFHLRVLELVKGQVKYDEVVKEVPELF